jgi:hypothetical protein
MSGGAKREAGAECWLDRPEITGVVFHPRPEVPGDEAETPHREMMIPVERGVSVGARLYASERNDPTILFFHGNGEIVADYDRVARFYLKRRINLLAVDYRGYGRSGGRPTVSLMLKDCRTIHAWVREWLKAEGYGGPFVVMGRSLGSASALELAFAYPREIDALILESSFAHVVPLLELLGADVRGAGAREAGRLDQLGKIRAYRGPTLIIHGYEDEIIPFSDAEDLFNASPDSGKHLLGIPDGTHNNLLLVGYNEYMAAVSEVMARGGGNQ